MKRFGWLIAFWVVVVVMGAVTPYVWAHESTARVVGWLVLLALCLGFGALLMRAEVLLRRSKPGADE